MSETNEQAAPSPEIKEPALIWTMGKVGSSSIKKSLRRAGFEPLHIHYLLPENVERVRNALQDAGGDLDPGLSSLTARIQENLPAWRRDGLKIVTGVRDPIARTISAYFQNYDLIFGGTPDEADNSHFDILTQPRRYDVPLTWFDREFKAVLDFDIYEEPFDPVRKYATYRVDNLEILLLRIDLGDDLKEKVLSKFFGAPITVMNQNIGEDKAYADAYRHVRNRIVIPHDLLDDIYSSKYCRRFWSAEEIGSFREFWRREAC